MGGLPIYQVDAFTARRFAGNPAAVCLPEVELSPVLMQQIAREMNLSETAFVLPEAGSNEWSLRWFTPKCEVDLCGHATLAAAKVLFDVVEVEASEVLFTSRSGQLPVTRDGSGFLMDFPADPPQEVGTSAELSAALGGTGPVTWWRSPRMKKALVVLPSEDAVRTLEPDFDGLLRWERAAGARGTIVTARGEADHDFVSRFFAPGVGIPEDPVTGAAHTVLSPYWSEVFGIARLSAFQASERGGELTVTHVADRVLLSGRAIVVPTGRLIL